MMPGADPNANVTVKLADIMGLYAAAKITRDGMSDLREEIPAMRLSVLILDENMSRVRAAIEDTIAVELTDVDALLDRIRKEGQ